MIASDPHPSATTAIAPPTRRRRCDDERGDSLVSFVLLMPILVVFLELIVLGGRVATTQADVNSAAREAARDASVAQGLDSAGSVIDDAVDRALAGKGFRCRNRTESFGDKTNFVADGRVEVVVTCTVDLSDLGFLGTPGSIDVEARAVEPVDRYRVVE
ncbi:MAG: TadE family protein [Ilumatobacter sp.]